MNIELVEVIIGGFGIGGIALGLTWQLIGVVLRKRNEEIDTIKRELKDLQKTNHEFIIKFSASCISREEFTKEIEKIQARAEALTTSFMTFMGSAENHNSMLLTEFRKLSEKITDSMAR